MKNQGLSRRTALVAAGAGLGALALGRASAEEGEYKIKGNINQSVSKWCYKMSLEELCVAAKKIGYKSIELLGPKDIPTVKKHGLTCAMLSSGGGSISDAFNRKENHDKLEQSVKEGIDCAAENELPNLIVMSGNRKGMSDEEGAANCVLGLKRVAGYAEQKKVTLCLELLNSKVNHKDYMADHTAWGVDVCKKIGSPRMKLLYDIYHMQIMEGDLIATIKANIEYLGHFHTGGVPGRAEIDETQEINYPAVMKAIVETGYKGFVGQEFVPKRDPLKSLEQAFRICDV
ncbi:MAG TPA: TIM barrel protein [Planctomycetota bacterium]|jgi:hydroxypyruvate isomerase